MNKQTLMGFVNRFHLGGQTQSAPVVSTKDTLSCSFINSAKSCVGDIVLSKNGFGDYEMGLYEIQDLIKLLNVLDGELVVEANEVGDMKVLGDVNGKDVVIIDDMVDTAGTLTKAADLMIKSGAVSVRAYCTHGVLSGEAYNRLDKSKITELVITDTIDNLEKVKMTNNIEVLTISNLMGEAIKRISNSTSVSDLFK